MENKRKSEALLWFSNLAPAVQTYIQENAKEICGISWDDFLLLFTQEEAIEIIYNKIKLDNYISQSVN